MSENIPTYLDVPIFTFQGLLSESETLFAEARAGRVYVERIRELFRSILRLVQGDSVWRKVLGVEADDLARELMKADGALASGAGALNSPSVRSAELACLGLTRRLEQPNGLEHLIGFVQDQLATPGIRFSIVDELATTLVGESLEAGYSKRALLHQIRRFILDGEEEAEFLKLLDKWRELLTTEPRNYSVFIYTSLPRIVEQYPLTGCRVLEGVRPRRQRIQLDVEARDPWSAALIANERLLDLLEPYAIAQLEFIPTVPRSGIVVRNGQREIRTELPKVLPPLPEFSIDQLMKLERLAQERPRSVNVDTLNTIRASLSQLRESIRAAAESRFLHLWIGAEILLGSHVSVSFQGILETLPKLTSLWSVQKRLEDLWETVQNARPKLEGVLDTADNAAKSKPDMRAWLNTLVQHADRIAAHVETELIRGRILWMGAALNLAADRNRPLGKYMVRVTDDVTHELYAMMRMRGRLVHRGTAGQMLHYPSRRLGAYLVRTLNSVLFSLARVPTHSIAEILSSAGTAYDRALATLQQPECHYRDYSRFVNPNPPFI